ncbi:hypothetical protein [Ulvibacterium sp.]|uniref:hypothetical protein n=1 Tax=Ulvibacterium sp. TaxID=2665914 RepID=UPI0026315A0B|nr:hypothetical protein [Ulvibacterium sp.]
MKKRIKYFLIGFLVMLLFTYILGLFDDAFRQVYQFDNWYDGIIASFKYYFLWVLPYWWFIILIGTTVIGLVFSGVGKLRRPS